MSLSSTRSVSSVSSSMQKSQRLKADEQGGAFVENIDTSNNVFVRDDVDDQSRSKRQQYEQSKNKNENPITTGSNYVPNALEALMASGVYDEKNVNNAQKMGAYNLSKEPETETLGQNTSEEV